jgi:GntR family transcriptional regulator
VLNKDSDQPLFMQIKEKLERGIEQKEPNSKIKSEPKLAEKYGVSRGTINKAIKELTNEGKLYRVPKKGTYVSPAKIQRHFDRLPSHSEDIKKRGLEPGVHLVELDRIIPEEEIRGSLNLEQEEIVWKIKRVRTANGEPIILSTSYLPIKIFPEITEEEVMDSLYQTLEEKYENRPMWAHERYAAVNADQVVASLLDIEQGKALMYSERLSFSKEGRPIEYATSYIEGDRYEIHIDINRPSSQKEKNGGINQLNKGRVKNE